MKIEILGTGCHKCLKIELLVDRLVNELGLTDKVEIVRVDDEHQIRRYMSPDAIPGLVIDGELVSERTIPDEDILKAWLDAARSAAV